MFNELMFIALAMATAIGAVLVYWGVPRRVVANWAIGMGTGYAAINAMLWLFFTGASNAPPTSRIAGGIALGIGIATGGVIARVLYRFGYPTRRDGA